MTDTAQIVNRWAARVCACMGILITAAMGVWQWQAEDDALRRHVREEVDVHAAEISRDVDRSIAILHSIRGLFEASEEVTREEFHIFTRLLLERYPAMTGAGWVPRVAAAEREAYEQRAREDGLTQIGLTARDAEGEMVRAGERDEYFPVYYLEPLRGNEAARFYDLASNPARMDAVQRARRSGLPRATERIRLVQETEADEYSVLIFVPVYDGAPKTDAERETALRGLVSGVFRLHHLLGHDGETETEQVAFDVKLIDVTDAAAPEVLHRVAVPDAERADDFGVVIDLPSQAGRQWRLEMTPAETYLTESGWSRVPLIVLIGLLMTGWISFYLNVLMRAKEQVEAEVVARTQELKQKSLALADTNASLHREAHERLALQRRVAEVTDHEQRRLGQELHDSLGQQIAVMSLLAQHLQGRGDSDEIVSRMAQSAASAQSQIRALTRGLLPVEIDSSGLGDALALLAESVQGLSDVEIRCVCDMAAMVDDNTVATHLYRIAQEALRNALEHGEVSHVELRLALDDGYLTLTVEDDGGGIPVAAEANGGAGMASMRHRADLVGAEFDVSSSADRGTWVSVRVPLAKTVWVP